MRLTATLITQKAKCRLESIYEQVCQCHDITTNTDIMMSTLLRHTPLRAISVADMMPAVVTLRVDGC